MTDVGVGVVRYRGPAMAAAEPGDVSGALTQLLAGDERAFAQLRDEVQRVFGQVWLKVRQRYPGLDHHRADIAQTLELHLVRNNYAVLRSFRGESRFSTWLYAVAIQLTLREAQRYSQHRAHGDAELGQLAASTTPVEETLAQHQARQVVRQILSELPPDDQLLVRLLFEEELDAPAVAQILGMTASGVRMKKMRLKSKLEARLRGLL